MTAVAKEEQAELRLLRERAERELRETADTLQALRAQAARAGNPAVIAQRAAGRARVALSGRRAVLAAIPAAAVVLAGVGLVLWRRAR